MRKRSALKNQRRPAMPKLQGKILPWSMQWKPLRYALFAAAILVTLGYRNASSSHWSSYVSHSLSPMETGIELEYPDSMLQITDDRALSDGRYITLTSKVREVVLKRPGGLYSPANDSDQIQIHLNYRDSNQPIAAYEKELRDHFSNKPLRINFRKYAHALGQAVEVTMDQLIQNSPSQEPSRYVLIVPNARLNKKDMSISASCIANPIRAHEFEVAFERIMDRIRLAEE